MGKKRTGREPHLFLYRTERKEYINAKYVEHRFARRTPSTATARQGDLYEAVRTRDLLGLVQLYADGVELLEPFPEAGQVHIHQARLPTFCSLAMWNLTYVGIFCMDLHEILQILKWGKIYVACNYHL